MAFTHTTQLVYKTTTQGVVLTKTFSKTASTEIGIDALIAAGALNEEKPASFLVVNLVSLMITSSQAVTIKTNDANFPAQEIPILAGQVITWSVGNGTACPIETDISDLFISNAGASAAIVQLRFLVNQ